MSCCVPFPRYASMIAMPYSRGGRSEAQQNAPRQGSALLLTACQTTHNVETTSCQRSAQKKKAPLSSTLSLDFFFSGSALHALTQSLRGEDDPGRPYPLIIPLPNGPSLRHNGRSAVFLRLSLGLSEKVTFYCTPTNQARCRRPQILGSRFV